MAREKKGRGGSRAWGEGGKKRVRELDGRVKVLFRARLTDEPDVFEILVETRVLLETCQRCRSSSLYVCEHVALHNCEMATAVHNCLSGRYLHKKNNLETDGYKDTFWGRLWGPAKTLVCMHT